MSSVPPKRMLINMAVSVAILGGNVGLAYGVSAVLARVLKAHDFGVYSLVIAVVTLLTIPATFGLPTLLNREIAAGSARGDFGLIRGLIRRSHQFIAATGAVMVAGGLVFAVATGRVSTAFLWGLPLILLMSLAAARSAMLRGMGRVVQGQWPEQLLRPALLVGLVVGAGLLGWRVGPAEAMALTALAAALALAVSLAQWAAVKPPELGRATARYSDRAWIGALIPFAFSAGILTVSAQIGLVILGMLRPPAEVAIFRVAAQTAQLGALGYTAVIMNITPRLAAAAATGDAEGQRTTALHGAIFATLFSLPVGLAMALGGSALLGLLFGGPYAAGAPALAILALGQVVNTAFGCGAAILNMAGHERDVTKALGLGLLCQVVASAALIPFFGATGAAAASVLGVIGSNVALQRWAILRTGVNPAVWAWRR
jgi:O-antigen/teichoic acid export membrane protein